jgi:hypothetical protein
MRTTDPIDRSDLPEAAIWKAAWERSQDGHRQENITGRGPVSRGISNA